MSRFLKDSAERHFQKTAQINNSLGNRSKWEEAGQELEDFIEDVCSISLKNENLKNCKIEKNHVEIGKSGTKYEFDVFYEVKIAGISHKVAIECKYHDKMITQDMVRDFWGKLNDCNNIRGFIVSTNEPQEEAKQLLKYYGIEVITEDELPNIPGLLLAHTKCLVPDENVHGDPFWTIMQLTEDGKNTGTCYSPNEKIALFISKYYPHRETALNGAIALFLSKKSAERVLKNTGENCYAVFGVSRQHLRALCYIAKNFNRPFAIALKLGLEKDGRILMFEHSYDQIFDNFDM
jgi:hypothetical protein